VAGGDGAIRRVRLENMTAIIVSWRNVAPFGLGGALMAHPAAVGRTHGRTPGVLTGPDETEMNPAMCS